MSKDIYMVIRGVLNYAKLTGTARPHTGLPKYDKGPSWSVDIAPDKKSLALLKAHGLTTGGNYGTGKLRSAKETDKNRVGQDDFLTLRVLENNSDGTKREAPKVVDVAGQSLGNKLIGNGSVADIKIKVVDYGAASDKGVYLQAVRVLDLVHFEIEDFAALGEDDEYFGAEGDDFGEDAITLPAHYDGTRAAPNPDDLDDDIPFDAGN